MARKPARLGFFFPFSFLLSGFSLQAFFYTELPSRVDDDIDDDNDEFMTTHIFTKS